MSLHAQDDPQLRTAQEERLRAVWKAPTGWFFRWTDVNNNRIGVWYTLTAFGFMLFAGVLALIMRTQLAVPDNDLVSANTFNQLFTLHGSMMMFLFAVPMFEAVSIILLPQLLGARDLPFPRLSAFGYWSFLIGGVFVSGGSAGNLSALVVARDTFRRRRAEKGLPDVALRVAPDFGVSVRPFWTT